MDPLQFSTIQGAADTDEYGPVLYAHADTIHDKHVVANELGRFARALGIYFKMKYEGTWYTIYPDGNSNL